MAKKASLYSAVVLIVLATSVRRRNADSASVTSIRKPMLWLRSVESGGTSAVRTVP